MPVCRRMRPKARAMTQHEGPLAGRTSLPGEICVVFCGGPQSTWTVPGPCRLPWRTVYRLWSEAAQLRASGKSSCCCWRSSTECTYTKHRDELYHKKKARFKTLERPLPSLWPRIWPPSWLAVVEVHVHCWKGSRSVLNPRQKSLSTSLEILSLSCVRRLNPHGDRVRGFLHSRRFPGFLCTKTSRLSTFIWVFK